MRFSLLFAASAAAALKVVEFELSKDAASVPARVMKRAATVEGQLMTLGSSLYAQSAFYATVQIGTPPQPLKLFVSTESSEIWVVDSQAPQCAAVEANCLTSFHTDKSQSVSKSGVAFGVIYSRDNYANGQYVADKFGFGQSQLNLSFGLGTNISYELGSLGGVLGLGYPFYYDHPAGDTAALLDQMVDASLINTQLYSVWLTGTNRNVGSLVFGGIDRNKYTGPLFSIPNQRYTSGMAVALKSVSISPQDGSSIPLTNENFTVTAHLATSTTFIFLPQNLVSAIYERFNVRMGDSGEAWVDCKLANSSYMTFGFGYNASINVPYSELVTRDARLQAPPRLPWQESCLLGIYAEEQYGRPLILLGQFFMHSAYIVLDMNNHLVGIAQSNPLATTSNITEVPAGINSIPGAVGATATASTSTISTTSRTSTATGTAASTTTSGAAAAPAATGAGPRAAVGALVLAGMVGVLA